MPKRTYGKQKPDGEAERERDEGLAREAEPDSVLTPEEVRAKHGEPVRVVELPNHLYFFYRDFHFKFKRKASPERKEDATTMEQPLAATTFPVTTASVAPIATLKPNTREKLLYKVACAGTPLGNEFFDQFPDRQEILELSLDISARLLIVGILNGEMPVTQRIAAMRVVASLAGKNVPDEEDEGKFKGAPPLAIPRGSKEEVSATLDKIRQLSGG